MTSSMMNFQKWIFNLDSQIWKQSFSHIYQTIANIRTKWIKHFQTSISLWIQYIQLKTQSQYNNALPLVNGTSLQSQAAEILKKMTIVLTETEQCVLRGLINIQKLYMIPLVRQKKLISQKQKNPVSIEARQKAFSKARSSSLTNSRKPSLFNTGIKPNRDFSNIKNILASTTQTFNKYAGINSTITKNLKGKPKYDKNIKKDEISLKQEDLLVHSSSNWNNNSVQNSMHKSMVEHFQQKQKIEGKSLSRVEQKIKNIEQNINEKLNIIMESLIKCQESAKDDKKQKQLVEECSRNQKQFRFGIIQRENERKENTVDNLKENHKQIKRSSLIKKCTINSIQAEPTGIEEVILTGNLISSKLLEKAEKSIQEFIGQTKKVKLPISQQFTNIFSACYISLCKKHGKKQNLQKLGIMKDMKILQMDDNWYRKQFKESLMKVKKLLSMETIKKDLAEKIRAYINQTIKCGYILLLFQEEYEVKEQTDIQINRIAEKL